MNSVLLPMGTTIGVAEDIIFWNISDLLFEIKMKEIMYLLSHLL